MLRNIIALLAPAVILGGCTVGPNYRPPATPVRSAWISAVDMADVDGAWWHKLRDPILSELVALAIAENKDIDEASARLREARAHRDAISGRSLPQIGASASATENRLSANGQLPVTKIPGFDPQFPIYDAGFDASWEIDLWGGTRRAVEGAEARVQAVEEARRGIILQVIAEVVRSYIDLRAAQNLRSSAIADAQAQQEVARIVADRVRVGAASGFDLSRAQAQARSTAAVVPRLEADAAAAAFRLALFVGRPPEAYHDRLSAPQSMPAADLQVSAGLRADLLRRRPDVRQAERDMAATSADVGVATAELFPRLTLIGGIGQQARSPGDLFSGDSLRFGFGPALRWPIFSGGRIRAQIRAADARAEAAAIRYERAVLNALTESETAINRFASARRTRSEREAVRYETGEAVRMARLRFVAGEDDLTVLLQAQSAFSAADRQTIEARAMELQQLAGLYKALGGGWETAEIAKGP